MTITIKSAVWENPEQTVMTVVFSNERYKNLPYGINLTSEDDSPISKEIVEMYKAKKFTPSKYKQPVYTNDDLTSMARFKRDNLLEKTDIFVSVPDYPLTESQRDEIKIYRQQLRDITKQSGFPTNIVWPNIPDCIKDKLI